MISSSFGSSFLRPTRAIYLASRRPDAAFSGTRSISTGSQTTGRSAKSGPPTTWRHSQASSELSRFRGPPDPKASGREGDEMSADPIEVVGEWLQNLLDPAVVNRLVAPDATYVSLNTDDPELQKIMPWAGTARGPQAFLNNMGTMFKRWENEAFNVSAMFASDENVAVFGDFRYRSHSLDKVVSSPFSIFRS